MGEVLLYFRMMQAYLTTRCTDEDGSCTPGISYVSKVDILMSVTSRLVSFFTNEITCDTLPFCRTFIFYILKYIKARFDLTRNANLSVR